MSKDCFHYWGQSFDKTSWFLGSLIVWWALWDECENLFYTLTKAGDGIYFTKPRLKLNVIIWWVAIWKKGLKGENELNGSLVPLRLDMSGFLKGYIVKCQEMCCFVSLYSVTILTYLSLSDAWCCRYVTTYHWAMVIRLGHSPARQLGQITQSVHIVVVSSRVKDIVTRPWPPPLSLRLHLDLLEDTGGELLQAGGPGRDAHVGHGDAEQSLVTDTVIRILLHSFFTNLFELFPFFFV